MDSMNKQVDANPFESEDTLALVTKKTALVKELEKQMDQISKYKVDKKQDRFSLEKTMEATQKRLDSVKQIDEILKKRDF